MENDYDCIDYLIGSAISKHLDYPIKAVFSKDGTDCCWEWSTDTNNPRRYESLSLYTQDDYWSMNRFVDGGGIVSMDLFFTDRDLVKKAADFLNMDIYEAIKKYNV